MTMGVRAERQGRVCHSGERRFPAPLPFWGAALCRPVILGTGALPPPVILGSGAFPLPPVILRSEGDEESLGHALGRERRFFAALRMTMGECAQNDNGGVCSE